MTTDLDNALEFATAIAHLGNSRECFLQAKVACRTLAAEIQRLRAELTDAREQLLSAGWCPDEDDPTLAQLCAHVATSESEARRQRDEAYDREGGLRETIDRINPEADGQAIDARDCAWNLYRGAVTKEQAAKLWPWLAEYEVAEKAKAMPKTADGVPVAMGDIVYAGLGLECRVVANADRDGLVADLFEGIGERIENCYSTREAAEEAEKR